MFVGPRVRGVVVVSYGKTLCVISRHAVGATVPRCETSTLRFEGGRFVADWFANPRGACGRRSHMARHCP
jgi:hypothetical protein